MTLRKILEKLSDLTSKHGYRLPTVHELAALGVSTNEDYNRLWLLAPDGTTVVAPFRALWCVTNEVDPASDRAELEFSYMDLHLQLGCSWSLAIRLGDAELGNTAAWPRYREMLITALEGRLPAQVT